MKKTRLLGCIAAAMLLSAGATAQNNGGIDSQMLKELSESYKPTTAEKALQNILLSQPIKGLALNQENLNEMDISATAYRQKASPTRSHRDVAGSSPAST